jgi:hypothetical protein
MTIPQRRLLLVACSATKDPAPGLLEAHVRYLGPAYRIIHNAARAGYALPQILILSAEFGLISWDHRIPNYNRKMTPARVDELVPLLLEQWSVLHPQLVDMQALHVHGGEHYRRALGYVPLTALTRTITWASGGIGIQNGQLFAWLRQQPERL